MSAVAASSVPAERVDGSRIWWVGLLALVGSVIANLLTLWVAGFFFTPPAEFLALTPGPIILFTVIGVLGAAIVYAVVGRFSSRPISLYRTIAAIVFLVSLAPDVLLFFAPLPGTTVPGVILLIIMHLWPALISVGLLTTLARKTV